MDHQLPRQRGFNLLTVVCAEKQSGEISGGGVVFDSWAEGGERAGIMWELVAVAVQPEKSVLGGETCLLYIKKKGIIRVKANLEMKMGFAVTSSGTPSRGLRVGARSWCGVRCLVPGFAPVTHRKGSSPSLRLRTRTSLFQ